MVRFFVGICCLARWRLRSENDLAVETLLNVVHPPSVHPSCAPSLRLPQALDNRDRDICALWRRVTLRYDN